MCVDLWDDAGVGTSVVGVPHTMMVVPWLCSWYWWCDKILNGVSGGGVNWNGTGWNEEHL